MKSEPYVVSPPLCAQPILERGKRADPAGEFDDRAPDSRRQVQPCDPSSLDTSSSPKITKKTNPTCMHRIMSASHEHIASEESGRIKSIGWSRIAECVSVNDCERRQPMFIYLYL